MNIIKMSSASILPTLLRTRCPNFYRYQNYASHKRFYRGTGIVQNENKWEVTLDHRRLKTPNGRVLVVQSEPLARAIAAEWDSQAENISQPTMHLTALCNTALDNPGKITSHDIANHLLEYLPTDTLLFHSDDEDELRKLQAQKWIPVLEWFQGRYNVKQEITRGLEPPPVTTNTRAVLARHFLSYDFPALNAFTFGVEALKSSILMLACVDKYLEPKEAVLLARLEEEYQVMSGGTDVGSPRPRPLSGGFWTLLSWLRREDHLSSNESLSSAGSDRTAVSFAFLTPAHYPGSALPVVVPPPGPPTDTYKQRVRERNLRRQYDRGLTLHKKYGLFRGEGFSGYDALTLPSVRRSLGTIGDRQERERRATSECYQRRAAHVPGKRRAPPPPARRIARCDSSEPAAIVTINNRRSSRKRPAPQPPVELVDKQKENIIQVNDCAISMKNHDDQNFIDHDISADCKPEKYTKKNTKDSKIKTEKSFLKQIFENKKRNSTVDITTVKVLPSISELDAQAAEIILNNKLKDTEAIDHQTIIQAVKENCCTKCFMKPCTCKPNTMSSILEQSCNKNASTYTQTEITLHKNNKADEKQKLKEMLKEMKDSLPKKTKHENTKIDNIHLNTDTSSTRSSKDILIMEAPTLRIENKSTTVSQLNNRSMVSSSQVQQPSQKIVSLSNAINKQDNLRLNTVENRANPISNDILNKSASSGLKPNSSNNAQHLTSNENKKLNTPLKISSLLNPIYIPKETQCLQKSDSEIGDNPKIIKQEPTEKAKMETANAVRDIVLNSAIKKKQITSPSQPTKAFQQNSNKSSRNPNSSTSQNVSIVITSNEEKRSDVERLSQHLRRRELVSKLEQSIAKGDELAAAEAASKLAQLRLSCSVLSFTSQILSEPSTSKIQPDENILKDQIKNVKSNVTVLPTSTHKSSKESNDTSKVVLAASTNIVQHDDTKTGITKSDGSPAQASTSKGLNNDADDMAIDVWVEDKEKTRGPIKLVIRRAATVRDLRRQAEQSLGLPSRLQRWIIGRTLCINDNTLLASLAGPNLNAPFYLCLVESDTKASHVNRGIFTNETVTVKEDVKLQSNETERKSSNVYKELVKLELQALVPNAEIFECEICMEQCKSGDGVVLRECVHSFCKSCLSDLIRHSEEPVVLCPAMGCPGELHEREIRALVSPEDYERWLARGLAAAESGTRNAFHCRTRDCSGWALCEVGVRRFPCPVCKHTNCVPCQAIHENETCEQHRARLLAAAASQTNSEPDEGTRALIDSLIARGEALQCPECSAIITKKWGCDWVKCSACKTEICWVTRGRRWGPTGRGDISGGCRCGVDGKRCHPSCGYCH